MRYPVTVALLLTLSACSAPLELEHSLALPEAWQGPMPEDEKPSANGFRLASDDPLLGALVEMALAGNLELAAGRERLVEGRALLREVRARALPSLEGSAGVARGRSGIGGEGEQRFFVPDQDSWEIALEESWTVDLFGAVRARLQGARQILLAEEAALAGLELGLAAAVAEAYTELRTIQAREAALAESLELAREFEWIAGKRFDAGEATLLDAATARADRLQLEADAESLGAGRVAAIFALETLAGQAPGDLAPLLGPQRSVPSIEGPPPVAQPAMLLLRRPDLRQATALLEAGRSESLAARRDLYPQLVLSGLLGRQGLTINGDSLGSGSLTRASATLSVPLFDFGARRAMIDVADAQSRQLLLGLEQAMLAALEDVETALVRQDALLRQAGLLGETVEARAEALATARLLQSAGEADLALVLDARRRLTDARLVQAEAQALAARAGIRLWSALGGGWEWQDGDD
ncbi:MAG: TolC family protein [Chromatiales bacterium]|nr:TolC family protein [Chromatiales bacterium]